MTSIGRFSLKSQTPSNLSNITLFLALSGSGKGTDATPSHGRIDKDEGGMTVPEFESAWLERGMPSRHPRFHSRVSRADDRYFELEAVDGDPKAEMHRHAFETLHTYSYRDDLRGRIERLLTEPMDVTNRLWEVYISSGRLGSSGAISRLKVDNIQRDQREASGDGNKDTESVLLFKAHHCLGDGVSLAAAISDLSDEAEELRGLVTAEIVSRRRKGKDVTLLQKLAIYLKKVIWFCFGSIRALLYQGYLLWTTPRNPFEEVISSGDSKRILGRSISWCDAAPLEEVKTVAHAMGPKVTLNDIFVSCVTHAVARQLAEHRARTCTKDEQLGFRKLSKLNSQNNINVVVPVHLNGGVILPGSSIGNRLGAMLVRCPGEMNSDNDSSRNGLSAVTASERLRRVHDSLAAVKQTPAPLISWIIAKVCSDYAPENITKWIFRNANANAAVVVSNARGSPTKTHINGRTVESSAGFLPLPPGIPVGVVVMSYAGTVSLSVTAERWAVPDGDQFMMWILEEYRRLCAEASVGKS